MNPQQADNLMVGREEVFEEQLFGGFYRMQDMVARIQTASGDLRRPEGLRLLVMAAALVMTAATAFAQTVSEPIRYTLSFPRLTRTTWR